MVRNAPKVSRRRKFRLNAQRSSEEADAEDDTPNPSLLQPSYMSTRLGSLLKGTENLFEQPTTVVRGHLFSATFYEPETKNASKLIRYWGRMLDGFKGKTWGEFLYDQLAVADSESFATCLQDLEYVLESFPGVEEAVARVHASAVKEAEAANSVAARSAMDAAQELVEDAAGSRSILEELIAFRLAGLLPLQRAKDMQILEFQVRYSNTL